MILSRYTNNYTLNFLKFLLHLRGPSTSVSAPEQKLLSELAANRKCIIEVGVFEGATSQTLCRAMDPGGKLYLVDPFIPEVRVERLLNVSFAQQVATKAVEPWRDRLEFVRQPSVEAAATLKLARQADLIFIDARHDYASVLEDFRAWAPRLDKSATMAFHDSRQCPARPDIGHDDGPVRLMREIERGEHGAWSITAQADSVTTIQAAS